MTTISAPVKAFLFLLVLLLVVLVNFFAQTPQPSPSPSPSASPSVSPSPSPSRSPSPTPLPGAQNFHQWGSVTVFNGLPSDSVRAIAQTPDGVMWFGTDNGLARFDGRRVQNFSPGGPDSNGILALKTAPSGELWIGTRAGAFVHSENRFRPVAGTQNFAITAILVGDETFLGTDAGFVLRTAGTDAGRAATSMFAEPITTSEGAAATITGLVQDDGQLLASTPGRGVFIVSEGSATELRATLRSPFIQSMARDAAGDIWLGTDAPRAVSGLSVLDNTQAVVRIPAPTSKVLALEANDSGVWAGTERFGLFHVTGSKVKKNYTFENTSGGLRSNNIFTFFTDREGVLWIGTNRGVSRFDRLGASQETVSDIPNSNFIRSLYRTRDGKLYAGSNRGLFTKSGDRWSEVGVYGNKPIYAISEDASGKLLVGTTSEITYPQNQIREKIDTRSFAHFRGRVYAAVSGEGFIQIRPGVGDLVLHGDQSVNSICAAQEKVWIGTIDKGLFSFDGTTVKSEFDQANLRSGTIWKLFVANDGTLWIAGQHGVIRVRDGQVEKIIDVEDVRDVFVDGGDVWAATTTRGLLHARNHEQFGWIVSSVGFEQGLPSEKAFSIVPIDGGLLIGTNRGVVTYKPGTVAPKLIPVRVLSQRVHDLNELRSTIALDYPQNSLLVEVAGQSSRTFPEEFQYAYVLKNGKGDIVDSRLSNDTQYAPVDLSPDVYTIESIAFNRDLIPSEPMTLSFSIGKAPFPWTATALAVLLLLALVGLAWAIIEHRRIAERNRELAAARLDLANEAERERRRIARDLHDQTLADLRNLMIKSDKLTADNSEFRGEIEAVSTEIRRICEDLSPSVLENVGLVAALEFLLDRTVANRKFTADDGVEERIDFPLNVQLQIYRIAQEVLTNIERHSDADLVEMNVEAANGEFGLTIRDNGRPFRPDRAVPTGRGISNIRSRANLINGQVTWKESRDSGNVFALRVNGQA